MSVTTDLVALISAVTAGRVYPRRAPASPVAPYITYFRVVANEQTTLDANGGAGNAINTILQIDIWAATYGDAQAKAQAVKDLLKTWSVENILTDDQDFDDLDTLLYRVMLQVSTWHT
ncbi:MAG TPA: DUF3168 domain-containing protein [Noviherbaspirillum sp.]|nr:DUF3168 domain-containing protein [Noviherbaspirillum sp.]